MLAMEEIMIELGGAGGKMKDEGLPPGFRFHPTDEELITFYLYSKVLNGNFCGVNIPEVDLNRWEPWELPEGGRMGEREWYIYSLRDRKYPTGLRTNRATCAGYWKATGKDREIYTTQSGHGSGNGGLVGVKKTLVFYKGRAPRGEKTKWVMHEYRLHSHFLLRHTCKEEWVICRIIDKLGSNNMVLQGGDQSTHQYHPPDYLPPLLEQGMPFLINEDQHNPVYSCFNLISTNNATANKEGASYLSPVTSLLKTVQCEEYCTNATISKLCKIEESAFPYFQSSNHIHMPPFCPHHQTPLTLTLTTSSCPDFMGFSSSPVGFQMLSDHSIVDSWPLP